MTTEVIEEIIEGDATITEEQGGPTSTALSPFVEEFAERPRFKPQDHFRNLKGQQYLEVKWRVVWFREDHPDGTIQTDLIEHDKEAKLAVVKARVGFVFHGREVFAEDYGSETAKDFGDYLEKAATKAIGRALAGLGYGTAYAQELDEGDRVVDSPTGAYKGDRSKGSYVPSSPPSSPGLSPEEEDKRRWAAAANNLEQTVLPKGKITETREAFFTATLGKPAPTGALATWSKEDLTYWGKYLRDLEKRTDVATEQASLTGLG